MTTLTDPGRPDDLAAGLDAAARADIDRSFSPNRVPVNADIKTRPDLRELFLSGHTGTLELATHQLLVSFPVVTQLTDVNPVERHLDGVQSLRNQQRKQVPANVVLLARRYEVDDFGLEDVDSSIHKVGPSFINTGFFLKRFDAA